jgi:hypothetical protein
MRVVKPYIITCAVFAILIVLYNNVKWALYQIQIPIVPQLAFWFIFLLALIIGMRVLGMLYFMHRRQLGWGV